MIRSREEERGGEGGLVWEGTGARRSAGTSGSLEGSWMQALTEVGRKLSERRRGGRHRGGEKAVESRAVEATKGEQLEGLQWEGARTLQWARGRRKTRAGLWCTEREANLRSTVYDAGHVAMRTCVSSDQAASKVSLTPLPLPSNALPQAYKATAGAPVGAVDSKYSVTSQAVAGTECRNKGAARAVRLYSCKPKSNHGNFENPQSQNNLYQEGGFLYSISASACEACRVPPSGSECADLAIPSPEGPCSWS